MEYSAKGKGSEFLTPDNIIKGQGSNASTRWSRLALETFGYVAIDISNESKGSPWRYQAVILFIDVLDKTPFTLECRR
jgi:hypothetical protein